MLHSKSFVLSSVFLTVPVSTGLLTAAWRWLRLWIVSETTKFMLREATFIVVSADEVITIDHESWLSVHVYVCCKGKWSCESILVMLMRLVEGNSSQAVKEAILMALTLHGGLIEQDIAEKVVCFGVEGVSVFKGCRAGVTVFL